MKGSQINKLEERCQIVTNGEENEFYGRKLFYIRVRRITSFLALFVFMGITLLLMGKGFSQTTDVNSDIPSREEVANYINAGNAQSVDTGIEYLNIVKKEKTSNPDDVKVDFEIKYSLDKVGKNVTTGNPYIYFKLDENSIKVSEGGIPFRSGKSSWGEVYDDQYDKRKSGVYHI